MQESVLLSDILILLQSEIPSGICAELALWQQATLEITLVVTVSKHDQLFTRFTSIIRCHSPRSLHRDHSIIACSRHIHNGVILHAHPVRGESHNQRNTTGEVATISLCTQAM